jgi:hypothetical protein
MRKIRFNFQIYEIMNDTVFWYVMPCNLVERYQRFRGFCSLHLQGRKRLLPNFEKSIKLHGTTAQETLIFVVPAVRTSDIAYYISTVHVRVMCTCHL